jgi:AAA domain-containing protein/UvrD-like helicase family protein/TOTE conflict system TATA-binding-like protein
MNIFNNFKNLNLSPGQETALTQLEAFLDSPTQVFVLKGYAGTGKTTLINGLVSYLKDSNKQVDVMAPTGRAAKVLRDNVGIGRTIHSSIYNFSDMENMNAESEEDADHSVRYIFPISLDNTNEKVIIVDEASMISAIESKQELFDFGTSILLDDLLSYTFSNNKNNQLIFVGDPAQLPPVTDNSSKALDIDYLTSLGYICQSTTLTEVRRQVDNAILENATKIRDLLGQNIRNSLKFKYDPDSFVKLSAIDVVDTYLNYFPNPDIGDGVIISYSNTQCLRYNQAIRHQLYQNPSKVSPGDLLLINSNNYHTYAVELFNGDIAKVVDVNDTPIRQSAPVWYYAHGKKEQKNVHLDFRKVVIKVPNYDGEISCYIIDSMLGSEMRDLSTEEMKALYINFVMRFNEKQVKRRSQGLRVHKVGSQEFKTALREDPFYNALRVKFGYAITCHKAQGGEWDTVFVDYYGRVGLSESHLRWCYTATTRGANLLYAIHPPNISPLGSMQFSNISAVNRLGTDAFDYGGVAISPFHTEYQHRGKSYKYWALKKRMDKTTYSIKKVESFGEFLERYTIDLGEDKEVQVQASHNGAGIFINTFKLVTPQATEHLNDLQSIMNEESGLEVSLNYTTEESSLEVLFNQMQLACGEVGATITNVVEEKDKYFVKYYLITDSYSSIQFYFNKSFVLSRAMPQSINGIEDEKLQGLILKLKSYAK